MKKKVCIIGLGNMGTAISEYLRANDLFDVSECSKHDDINEKLKDTDSFVVCIKPQNFAELAETVTIDLSDKICVSIMAGISLAKLKTGFAMLKVVRVMPNLPLSVGKALSGWIASEAVEPDEKTQIKKFLSSFGEEVEVDDENKIDAITALSGSGPAYFYFLTELIEKSAKDYGFSDQEAAKIASQTFCGSARLLCKSDESAGSLLKSVMSKGGTTEAAFRHMFAKKSDQSVIESIE